MCTKMRGTFWFLLVAYAAPEVQDSLVSASPLFGAMG